MNYKKLIGYKLDTNQFTSYIIENEKDARMYISTVIGIYGNEILKYMFREGNRFTSYKKEGVSLHDVLYS